MIKINFTGMSIAVDIGVVLTISALIFNNPLGSSDTGQMIGFGLGLVAFYYAVEAVMEIYELVKA